MMAKKSVDTYLHFLRYYLLGVLDICGSAKDSAVQMDLIELYAKTALSLVDEITPVDRDEDPNDITNEV